jgi:hypothetical protein
MENWEQIFRVIFMSNFFFFHEVQGGPMVTTTGTSKRPPVRSQYGLALWKYPKLRIAFVETMDPRNHTNQQENSVRDISWFVF